MLSTETHIACSLIDEVQTDEKTGITYIYNGSSIGASLTIIVILLGHCAVDTSKTMSGIITWSTIEVKFEALGTISRKPVESNVITGRNCGSFTPKNDVAL